MRIGSRKIELGGEEDVVIKRGDGEPVVFRIKSLKKSDYTKFDQMCPKPPIPISMNPKGEKWQNPENPTYQKKIEEWGTKRMGYMMIKSLMATPDLHFDTVDIQNPDTYDKLEDELTDAGFSVLEIGHLFSKIMQICGLDQKKIEQATQDFLAMMGSTQEPISSPSTEQVVTQSGEPAKD